MMTTLVVGMLSGLLIGIALTVQWGKIAKMHADERLVERNEHLEAEVVRLRAQVALHINPCRPAGGQVDLRTAA